MMNKNFNSNSTFGDFRELLSRSTPFVYIHFKKNPPNGSLISKYNQLFTGGEFEYNTAENIGEIKSKIVGFTGLEVDFYYQTESEGKISYNKLKKEFDGKTLEDANGFANDNQAKNIQDWLAGFISRTDANPIQEEIPVEAKTNETKDLQDKIKQLYSTDSEDPLFQSNRNEMVLLLEKHPDLLNDVDTLDKYLWVLYNNENTKEKSLQMINHWWPLVTEKKKLLFTALCIYSSFEKYKEIVSIHRSDPSFAIKGDFYFNKIIWALYKNDGTENEALDLINEKLSLLQKTDKANYSIGCIFRYHAKNSKDKEMLEKAIHYFTLDKNEKEASKTKAILEEWNAEESKKTKKSTEESIDDILDLAISSYKKLQSNQVDKYWGTSDNRGLIDYCEENPGLLKDGEVMIKYLWSMYERGILMDEVMLEKCYQITMEWFQKNAPNSKESKFIYACILRSMGWRKKDKNKLEQSILLFEDTGTYGYKNETEKLLKDMDGQGINWQFFSETMDAYHDIITKSKEASAHLYYKNKKESKLKDAGISPDLIDSCIKNKKTHLWIVHCSVEAKETSIGKLIIPAEGKLLRDGAKDFIKAYWSVLDKYWIKKTPLNQVGSVSKVNIIEINEFTY